MKGASTIEGREGRTTAQAGWRTYLSLALGRLMRTRTRYCNLPWRARGQDDVLLKVVLYVLFHAKGLSPTDGCVSDDNAIHGTMTSTETDSRAEFCLQLQPDHGFFANKYTRTNSSPHGPRLSGSGHASCGAYEREWNAHMGIE
jgi:hypothetical protein